MSPNPEPDEQVTVAQRQRPILRAYSDRPNALSQILELKRRMKGVFLKELELRARGCLDAAREQPEVPPEFRIGSRGQGIPISLDLRVFARTFRRT